MTAKKKAFFFPVAESQQNCPILSFASGKEEYVRQMGEGRSEDIVHCDMQLFEHKVVL